MKRRLEVYESMGHADVLKEYQKRSRQEHEVTRWQDDMILGISSLENSLEGLDVEGLEDELFEKEDALDASLLTVVESATDERSQLKSKLQALLSAASATITETTKTIESSKWAESTQKAKADFSKLETALKEAGAGDPAEYGKLVDQLKVVQQRIGEFDKQKKMRDELTAAVNTSFANLGNLRKSDLTFRRAEFLREVVDGNEYVRMRVVPFGNKVSVINQWRQVLGTETAYEKDLERLATQLFQVVPEDDKDTARTLTLETALENVKKQLHLWAIGDMTVQPEDKRFAAFLQSLNPEVFDRLDIWFPDDTLNVEYNPGGDGEAFKPIDQGSPGQKTAAILAFLMAHGTEPLILDQPEDDLDNALIYGLIVKQLVSVKLRRQVIIVTHNPNIVVHGDTEFVQELIIATGQSQINSDGGLQEVSVRETICRIMEGGREAFERRYRRLEGAFPKNQ